MASVALTFDDGPWPGGTDPILDVLRDRNVHTTFFVWGEQAAAHPDLVRAAVGAGHSVQPHCWRHTRHQEMTVAEIASDIDTVIALLEELAVPAPRFWRPPWGYYRADTMDLASERGLELAGWHIDPGDYDGQPAAVLLERVAQQLRNSRDRADAVVLLHDCPLEPGQWTHRQNVDETVELLRRLVDAVGHEFGPLVTAVPDHLQLVGA